MVWPNGWVCQAVRAPGVKWTLAAPTREGSGGAATASMNTAPVNQSAGPLTVSCRLRMICKLSSLRAAGSWTDHHLQRLALVHRPVAVGDVFKLHGPVEDAARLDRSVDDVWQKFVHVGTRRSRP